MSTTYHIVTIINKETNQFKVSMLTKNVDRANKFAEGIDDSLVSSQIHELTLDEPLREGTVYAITRLEPSTGFIRLLGIKDDFMPASALLNFHRQIDTTPTNTYQLIAFRVTQ